MNVSWDYRTGSAASEYGVAIDRSFRRAADVTDPDAIRGVLCPAVGIDPGSGPVDILHVSYVPGRELRVVYGFAAPPGGRAPIVRVDLAPPGTAAALADRARRRAVDPDRVRLVAAWDAVAWRVPEDDRLPALAALMEPARAARVLSGVLGVPLGPPPDVHLLSYVPRRRAVLRYDGTCRVVAKVGRMRDEGDCHRRQRILYDLPGREFLLPRPLGYDPTLGARLEQAVDGAALDELVAAAADPERLIGDVAAAIAALHRATLPVPLPRIGSSDLLGHLDGKTLARLSATLPDLAPRIAAVAGRLRATEPVTGATVTLHGDFHPANLLIGPNGPVFIDLDNLAVGPPERDLAVFAGRMMLLGLKDGGRVERLAEAALALPERYVAAGGQEVDDDAFSWYLAATVLARQIANGVRRLAPGLPGLAESLLDVAEERLGSVSSA